MFLSMRSMFVARQSKMSGNKRLVKKLQNALKISGFNVRTEFVENIIQKLTSVSDLNNGPEFEQCLCKLTDLFTKICENSRSIEREHVQRVLEKCTASSGQVAEEPIFTVISAFEVPKFDYDPNLQQFVAAKSQRSVLAPARAKIDILNDRYNYVLQRTRRNFKKMKDTDGGFVLETVDCLLTRTSRNDDKVLYLGSLFQATPGKYYLEDPTGSVELDLSHAKYHGGFFVDNEIVLVHGHYSSNILQVSTMTLPPGEEYRDSKPFFGNFNYFSTKSVTHLRESDSLKEHLLINPEGYIYFFSNLWLDQPTTFEKLQEVLEGLQATPPLALVFLGDFSSEPHDLRIVENLKSCFLKLAQLLKQYQFLVSNTRLVFVPGMLDPHVTHIYPRFPLPKYVTESFTKQFPSAIFTTNPCRIQYSIREIIVCSTNLMEMFLENSLHKPSKAEIHDTVARTVISQGHLAPFSLEVLPVFWDYDHSLRLYPTPNLIVVGDQECYKSAYKGCNFASVGPFTKGGFEFVGYNAFGDSVEECRV